MANPTDTVTLPRHFVTDLMAHLNESIGVGARWYANELHAALEAKPLPSLNSFKALKDLVVVAQANLKTALVLLDAKDEAAKQWAIAAEKELEETRLNAWKLADEVAAEEAGRRRTAETLVRDQKQALRLWLHLVSRHGPGGCGIHNPFHDLKTLTEAHARDHGTDLGNFHHDLADLSHDILQLGTVLKEEGRSGTFWDSGIEKVVTSITPSGKTLEDRIVDCVEAWQKMFLNKAIDLQFKRGIMGCIDDLHKALKDSR